MSWHERVVCYVNEKIRLGEFLQSKRLLHSKDDLGHAICQHMMALVC
jgi:hypothetical protein